MVAAGTPPRRFRDARGPARGASLWSGDRSDNSPLAQPWSAVADLLPFVDDGGAGAVPIMESNRIVAGLTRADLLSALARSVARGSPH